MTTDRLYLGGLVLVGAIGLGMAWLLGPELRYGALFGVLIGLVIQAPLGWWTLRSIGTGRFQLAWVSGMVVRLVAVVLAGLVLAPEYHWNTGALLAALVATLLVLLAVEALAAVREQSRVNSR